MPTMAGLRLGRIACSSCRHDVLRRALARPSPSRRFHSALASSQHPSILNDARLRFADADASPVTRRRGKKGEIKDELGFFEKSFLSSRTTGILGLGGGHVGRSAEGLEDTITCDSNTAGPPPAAVDTRSPSIPPPGTASPSQESARAYSPSTEAASFTTPFWRPIPPLTWKRQLALYQALAKFRLSSLVVLTAMAGYAMAPSDPSFASSLAASDTFVSSALQALPSVSSSSHSPVGGTLTLLSTALGTLLCSASANAINQIVEAPYDAQMSRTRGRPMVRRLVTPFHAATFSACTGITGVSVLAAFVNPLTAFLGLSNIVLYGFVYTPLKRVSIINTWVGAVVGAIPPLMGWAASTGTLDPVTQLGAWLLCFASFAWQFPHFNSFAHNARRDYAKAGYRMMSVTNPALNARVSLRYALLWLPLCSWAIPAVGMTSWTFAGLSLVPNALMAVPAVRFWRWGTDQEARRLFWASLVHLPVVLVLMMACKTDKSKSALPAERQHSGEAS